jgi:Ni/Co efflux regulator RcnB
MVGEMRRLMSLLAAAALVAGPLATAGSATGKEHHDGGGRPEQRGGRGEGRGEDGGRWMGGGRGMPAPQPYRGGEYRGGGYDRADPRMAPRTDPRGYRGEPTFDPRYDPRGYGPPPGAYGAAPRRGGYLGPGSGGQVIQDYERFRLRAPPRGYEWVHTPGGMALVSQATGQVFDVVPY